MFENEISPGQIGEQQLQIADESQSHANKSHNYNTDMNNISAIAAEVQIPEIGKEAEENTKKAVNEPTQDDEDIDTPTLGIGVERLHTFGGDDEQNLVLTFGNEQKASKANTEEKKIE